MGYGYRTYSNGVKTRFTRGAPREYTCTRCGDWMKGADNCFPGVCTPCLHAEMKDERTKRTKEKEKVADVKTKPFTVLLLYPDYLADTYGQDTYETKVTSGSVKAAIKAAQLEVLRATGSLSGAKAKDFYPLAVYSGHLSNLAFGGKPL